MSQIAIDFLLGPDVSSRLIAYFGQGSGGYSHVASVLADGRYLDARSDTLGGILPGVHIRLPETEIWVKKRRATLEVTQAEYDAWEENLRAKISADYGKTDIADFIFGKTKHIAGQWICSALAINAVQHLSRSWHPSRVGYIPYPLPVPAHSISPNAALLILATAGFTLGEEEFNGKS